MTGCKGNINSFESFGSVDGPGVRFVIFMQGCDMRCRYCHNPETWSKSPVAEYSSDEVMKTAMRFSPYWGEDLKNGGITVSGGEPLLQMDFLTDLFELAKENGIHTAIDTSGQPFSSEKAFMEKFDRLADLTDLFIVDIKMFDDSKHKELTGHSNKSILSMMRHLSERGNEMWIRRVLVPGLTDDSDDLKKTAEFIRGLKTVSRAEVLPYNALGIPKWEKIGVGYTLKDAKSPTKEEISAAETLLGIKH